MTQNPSPESSPLTFDLKEELLCKLEKQQHVLGFGSKSEVIRHAISVFDYASFQPVAEEHKQISVRLPARQKSQLLKLARQKKVSVGELLRVALDALPASPAGLGTNKKTASVETMKKATKKAAKPAAKKAAKKAKK
jgi:Arc/MetJ-type ribon-helix-helix transcriptional regulator